MYRVFLSLLSLFVFLQIEGLQADFQANYAEALQKTIYFFDAQRSGALTDNRVPWRSDSALNDGQVQTSDGKTVDLAGGYYDAGDNIKYGFPFAFSMTILAWSLYEFGDSYENSGQIDYALKNLQWGTDYILKAWQPDQQRLYAQVGITAMDHDYYYVPYELLDLAHQQKAQSRKAYYIDKQYPGSDLAGSTAAALASASLVFQRYGNPIYAQKLLTAAQSLYQFGKSNPGIYSDSVAKQGEPGIRDSYDSFSGGSAADKKLQEGLYLGLAAAWLTKATGNAAYLNDAALYVPADASFLDAESSNWSNNAAGSFILLSQLTSQNLASQYQAGLKNWIKIWQKVKQSPQGLISYSSDGNLSYVSNMAFLALVYSKTLLNTDPTSANQIQQWIKGQADYILGKNSSGMSYVVGYGAKWPVAIQHATAQGGWSGINDEVDGKLRKIPDRHIDFGAVVGGPDKNDVYNADRLHYQSTETALDYVAGFQGVAAGLNALYPGIALANFPAAYDVPTPSLIDQYYVQTQLTSQSDKKTIVKASIYNHSYWPAQVIYQPSVRVYLTIYPLVSSQFQVIVDGKTLTLQPYDASRGIYYFAIELNDPIYPGGIETVNQFPIPSYRAKTFTIQTTSSHNFAQDWSLQNISKTQSALNAHIAFYGRLSPTGNLVKISGSEPSAALK